MSGELKVIDSMTVRVVDVTSMNVLSIKKQKSQIYILLENAAIKMHCHL